MTLTADNAVQLLMSDIYAIPDEREQDRVFARVARLVFDARVAGPTAPSDFVTALGAAAREGQLLVAPFDDAEADLLIGTRVGGDLSADDGRTPHVDLALNSATASKMTYYLCATPTKRRPPAAPTACRSSPARSRCARTSLPRRPAPCPRRSPGR